ncbi:iron permease FTR1 family-domain-containing protein, partial [Chytriomyces sp. MP71]
WAGAVTGLLVAVTVGSGLVLTIWFLKEDILGEAGETWENVFELFAAILQTYIALKFISYTSNTNSNAMTAKWQRKIHHHLVTATAAEQVQQQQRQASQSTISFAFDTTEVTPTISVPVTEPRVDELEDIDSQTHKTFAKFDYPFAILAFSVVLREGMESVIYLTGISAGESPSAIAIPGLLGIALSICTGVLIYQFSAHIELRPLMITSVCMMLVLSAALVSEIAGEAEEYLYESWWQIDDDDIPALWDLSGCCDEMTVPLFQVLSALIGWKARPTAGSMGGYLLYWVFIAVFVVVKKKSSATIAATQINNAALGEEDVDEDTPLLGTA